MYRSAELQIGTVFCVRGAAIVPTRSSALHPYGSCCGLFSKQTLPQLRQSPGAMAFSVFHLLAQLGERLFMTFRNEEWIVAKTARPSRRKADPAIAHALE